MAAGNFSNGGLDTFDPEKRYIGVRLQQGVPLLDRDWNEAEDIRRHEHRQLAEQFLGNGPAGEFDFEVRARNAVDDVFIAAGHFLLHGNHLYREGDPESGDGLMFSEQGNRVTIPPTLPGGDKVYLFVRTQVARVDSADDPDLANSQDINMETCVRDRLDWFVDVSQHPMSPLTSWGPHFLAVITRPAGTQQITSSMISDLRRPVRLNLGDTVFRMDDVEERLDRLEQAMEAARVDIESMKADLGRLFWDVEVSAPLIQSLMGDHVTLEMRAVDRLGTPVHGATLTLSTDFGYLQPAVVSTGPDGRASATLVGLATEREVPATDIARLSLITKKVAAATLSNPGSIEYAKVRFEPDEMALVSRYTPASHFEDLIADLPDRPIVGRPSYRTATVTVHAKEAASVRGVGSTQVSFGWWQRDWALTKLHDVVSRVQVGSRIGDAMRRGVTGTAFDQAVVSEHLADTLQSISDQTNMTVKQSLFADPDLTDDDLRGSGFLGQVITQEATAAIGATAHQAIATQVDQLVNIEAVELGANVQRQLTQQVSQITAGLAQNAKQVYSVSGRLG